MLERAVFIDRDGPLDDLVYRGDNFFVAGKKVDYTAPYTFAEFKPKAGVVAALQTLRDHGFLTILVTNQPDVRYGVMQPAEYERIMAVVRRWPWDDIYECRHGRDDNCACRKPKPGMLLEAAKKHNLNLGQCFMVGDTESDLAAGQAAGCVNLLVKSEQCPVRAAVPTFADFTEAVDYIVNL